MIDLEALNSATKYPSIQTYHALGGRGSLTEEVTKFHGDVVLTEKVDGSNSRIVRMPDGDWFIGSREELLTARGDRVWNPAIGIVAALRELADGLTVGGLEADGSDGGDRSDRSDGGNGNDGGGAGYEGIMVFFLETYGAKIGGQAKQYTGTGQVGYRMFDLALIPLDVLGWDRGEIAAWREGGGQPFASEAVLGRVAGAAGIGLTPRLATIPAAALPTSVADTHAWLTGTLPATLVGLDADAGGRAEGIVLRTADRGVIAKARFQDYERTLKRHGGGR
jgi:hypothetical protein